MRISAIIPAYNEGNTIADVVRKTKKHVHQVIVVDDCSSDHTASAARTVGAHVISNETRIGYIDSIKKGFRKATGDIIVTLDGDGEHNPEQIADLMKSLLQNDADLVLGKREKITRNATETAPGLPIPPRRTNSTGTSAAIAQTL